MQGFSPGQRKYDRDDIASLKSECINTEKIEGGPDVEW